MSLLRSAACLLTLGVEAGDISTAWFHRADGYTDTWAGCVAKDDATGTYAPLALHMHIDPSGWKAALKKAPTATAFAKMFGNLGGVIPANPDGSSWEESKLGSMELTLRPWFLDLASTDGTGADMKYGSLSPLKLFPGVAKPKLDETTGFYFSNTVDRIRYSYLLFAKSKDPLTTDTTSPVAALLKQERADLEANTQTAIVNIIAKEAPEPCEPLSFWEVDVNGKSKLDLIMKVHIVPSWQNNGKSATPDLSKSASLHLENHVVRLTLDQALLKDKTVVRDDGSKREWLFSWSPDLLCTSLGTKIPDDMVQYSLAIAPNGQDATFVQIDKNWVNLDLAKHTSVAARATVDPSTLPDGKVDGVLIRVRVSTVPDNCGKVVWDPVQKTNAFSAGQPSNSNKDDLKTKDGNSDSNKDNTDKDRSSTSFAAMSSPGIWLLFVMSFHGASCPASVA